MNKQVTGQDIIEEIVSNLQASLEPLLYSTLVPGRFEVYLNDSDYDRLQGIFPRIIEEAEKALDSVVKQLNKRARWSSFFSDKAVKHERAQSRWEVYILKDEDEELKKGQFLVVSQLALPVRPELGGESQTRRVTTRRIREGSETINREPEETPKTWARIEYEDDRGKQTYLMMKNQIVVGRGGREHWVDLKLYTLPDVSREHFRLRYDAATKQFYIKDVSSLGTTVNGEGIPSSIEITNDEECDKNVEVQLPPKANIGLADVVVLNFEAVEER
jgi:FHA domain